MKLFSIPNIITLLNLLCGCLAIVFAFDGNLVMSAYLVGIAAVLDFLDGFVARALKQFSPIGKDLDSLADMVTFGVVPGVVMFVMLKHAMLVYAWPSDIYNGMPNQFGTLWKLGNAEASRSWVKFVPYIAFLIPLFSALRLAKFNNDTRQSDSFIGVPTPANSILICSLPLIANYRYGIFGAEDYFGLGNNGGFLSNQVVWPSPEWIRIIPWFLIGVTLLMSYLLISEIPLFALKVKGFGWKENKIRYIFLAISLVMIVLLKFIALPLIIVLYVLMSVVNNMVKKRG